MKQSIVFVLLAILVLQTASADLGDALNRLNVMISSRPEEGGNVTDGELSYRLGEKLSSRLLLRSKTSTESDELGEAGDYFASLYQSAASVTEIFLFPVSLFLPLSSGLSINAGVGAYLSAMNQKTAGFFQTKDPVGSSSLYNTNSYEDQTSGSFYGPLVAVGGNVQAGPISLYGWLDLVPVFFFAASNSFQMSPLVDGTATKSWDGMGWPYLASGLRGRIFFIELDARYEYQRYPWSYATPVGDPQALPLLWGEYSEALTQSHTVTLIGNIVLPILRDASIIIGYGRKLAWTDAAAFGNDFTNKGVVNLSFDYSK
jgi:hypothetical protein